jgi:phosphoglycerate dehydrogenase-like enzyme
MARSGTAVLVGEEDYLTALVRVVLDPAATPEARAAFADFYANDLADFDGWCDRIRRNAGRLYPAEVRMAPDAEALPALLRGAHGLIVESIPVDRQAIMAGESLVAIQKYGAILRNIDLAACAERSIAVLTLRRRANIAVAEMALCLMLMLAKQAHRLAGRVSVAALADIGYPYKPFDRRHTPNSNWARVPGIRTLYGETLGIIGLGEIGREIAMRAAAAGMRILYYQRTRLQPAEEQELQVTFAPLDDLFAQSDWIVPHLPSDASTRGLIDHSRFAQMKPGAMLVNVSRADVVERDALIDALASGRIAGFALDPLYEEPMTSDDELLRFENVILLPHIASQPRFNMLSDVENVIAGLAKEVGARLD